MKRRRGFSLVELVIAVAIIGLLVALAIPRVISQSERAAYQATRATFLNIERAVQMYRGQQGAWPVNSTHASMPPGLEPYLLGNPFKRPVPIGGYWDWNSEGSSYIAFGHNISIRGLPVDKQRVFDRMFDDNSLTTGEFRADGTYYVRPVAMQ